MGGAAPVERVEVVGLATGCCVLSTVLAMADAGVAVTVSAAGCGGSTPRDHERPLALMELYAPLVTVVRSPAPAGREPPRAGDAPAGLTATPLA